MPQRRVPLAALTVVDDESEPLPAFRVPLAALQMPGDESRRVPLAALQPPDFRTSNQIDPQTGEPVIAPRGDIQLPHEEPLTGWRGAVDTGLNALVGTVKGVTGLGEQGPAGPTWTNAGALAAAIPLGIPEAFVGAIAKKLPRFAEAVRAYRAPTEMATLAQPFYSRLDEAAAALPGKFGAGQLAKGGVSAEELAMRGVPEFLAAQGTKPIPKGALEAHLAAHPVPGVEVKVLGTVERPPGNYTVVTNGRDSAGRALEVSIVDPTGAVQWSNGPHPVAPDQLEELIATWHNKPARGTITTPTKFPNYQLPGGTNYRETLITLPAKKPANNFELQQAFTQANEELNVFRRANPDAELEGLANPDYRRLVMARNRLGEQLTASENAAVAGLYRGPHYDEPNILAHTRSNEREIPGLGKGTFLEEGQSDWLQTGKEEGFRGQVSAADFSAHDPRPNSVGETLYEVRRKDGTVIGQYLDDRKGPDEAIRRAMSVGDAKAVPDAPFKDTWPDLFLKHHLAEAASNPETQWLGFTSGKIQTDRWGTERLTWRPAEGGGYAVTFEPQVAGNALGGDLGAQGLAAGHIRNETRVVRSEADLQQLVSGSKVKPAKAWKRITGTPEGGTYLPRKEGMEYFYDKELPAKLEKIVKPYGGTVERVEMPAGTTFKDAWIPGQPDVGTHEPVTAPAWILRLTPELKQRILRYGLPLLTGVAAVEAGTGETDLASLGQPVPPRRGPS